LGGAAGAVSTVRIAQTVTGHDLISLRREQLSAAHPMQSDVGDSAFSGAAFITSIRLTYRNGDKFLDLLVDAISFIQSTIVSSAAVAISGKCKTIFIKPLL